jgi:hypothetical protein
MRGVERAVLTGVMVFVARCTPPRTTGNTASSSATIRDGEFIAERAPTLPPAPPSTPPVIAGCTVFPPDNPWNRDISGDPIDARSDEYLANIAAHGGMHLHADFGALPRYGIPFVIVPASQPMVPVRFRAYPGESDPGPYPIPEDAPIEAGRDHHVIVLQQDTCRLYELYHATPAGHGWLADSGAVFDLRSNALRPNGWTSCDQAGLPILPGLVRYAETTEGAIRHAIRVTFDHTQSAWISPARHPGDANDRSAPPMGLRLRLKADYDLAPYRGAVRMILEALKRYGMIVADTGSNWYLTGAPDLRWATANLRALEDVPGTAFEVVQSGPIMRRQERRPAR